MRLSEYLALEGLTLAVFARKVGRSESTISRLVRGETQPDWETVSRIAKATKGAVTANDFMTGKAA